MNALCQAYLPFALHRALYEWPQTNFQAYLPIYFKLKRDICVIRLCSGTEESKM